MSEKMSEAVDETSGDSRTGLNDPKYSFPKVAEGSNDEQPVQYEEAGPVQSGGWDDDSAPTQQNVEKPKKPQRCHKCQSADYVLRDCLNPPYCPACGTHDHTRRDCTKEFREKICSTCLTPSHEGVCKEVDPSVNRLQRSLAAKTETGLDATTLQNTLVSMIKQSREPADAARWLSEWLVASACTKETVHSLYEKLRQDPNCPWIILALRYDPGDDGQVLSMKGERAEFVLVVSKKVFLDDDINKKRPVTCFRTALNDVYPYDEADNKDRLRTESVGFVFGRCLMVCEWCHKEGCNSEKCGEWEDQIAVCGFCGQHGHSVVTCKKPLPPGCVACGRSGHHVSECKDQAGIAFRSWTCHYCKTTEHLEKDCPDFAVNLERSFKVNHEDKLENKLF